MLLEGGSSLALGQAEKSRRAGIATAVPVHMQQRKRLPTDFAGVI
jgi:hypothetical protein